MISTLQGELIARQEASVIVEVAGVGFEVFMSMRDMAGLPQAGSRIRILTKLMVRDDAMVLYGFSTSEGKRVFEKLIGVSGVGPKVALAILSTYAPSDIVAHVVGQDAAAIQRVPGVGKKMASRIILELKDSFGGESVSSVPTQPSIASGAVLGSVMEALLSMGFTAAEAELSLKGHVPGSSEADLLRYALGRLGE